MELHSEEVIGEKMTIKNEIARSKQGKPSNQKRDDLFVEFMMPFDRIFDEFVRSNFPGLQTKFGTDFFEKGSYPKVDILENLSSIVIEAAVPGMSKEDIVVDVHDGVLTISGEKRSSPEDSRGSYIHRELKRSSFRRSWTLAENLDSSSISAKFENGMLFLTIPKLQQEELSKPRQIKIQ
jgi:HSP20 family protein